MKKVAIFGGTFDPVHLEHIALVKSAIEELELDKLIIVPTFLPPHKNTAPLNPTHRINMLSLAFSGIDKVEISDYEVLNEGKSYSYLTAEHFKKEYDCELYILVGADMLRDFPTWKNPDRILKACTLVAFNRENYLIDEQKERLKFRKKFGKEFLMLSYFGKEVSSTRIRIYSALNLNYGEYVPKAVINYIKKEGIYEGDFFTQFVLSTLPEKRVLHTAEVYITAMQKCKELGLDAEKIRLATLLHDCAKYLDYKKVKGFNLPENMPEPVIHAFLGAFVAENVLGIKDGEVIDAIKYHTSGKANMTTLGKLVFVADMIERGRNYEGVENLREAYKKDFEECFLECLKEEGLHLKNKKADIYFETLNAYKYYLQKDLMEN